MGTLQPDLRRYLTAAPESFNRSPISADDQLEIARMYRPDGSLAGERVRVRKRHQFGVAEAKEDDPGVFALLWLAASAWACAAGAHALIGGWAGVGIGLVVWAVMVKAWMR